MSDKRRMRSSSIEREEVDDANESEDSSSVQPRPSTEEVDIDSDVPRHDEIAARAYQYWQERRGVHGSSAEDWQRAEQELRAERAFTKQNARAAMASA